MVVGSAMATTIFVLKGRHCITVCHTCKLLYARRCYIYIYMNRNQFALLFCICFSVKLQSLPKAFIGDMRAEIKKFIKHLQEVFPGEESRLARFGEQVALTLEIKVLLCGYRSQVVRNLDGVSMSCNIVQWSGAPHLKSTSPSWIFLSLGILLKYWIEHVTLGLVYMYVRLCNWLSLCCFWISSLKWWWVWHNGEQLFHCFNYVFTYILIHHNMTILHFSFPHFNVSNDALFLHNNPILLSHRRSLHIFYSNGMDGNSDDLRDPKWLVILNVIWNVTYARRCVMWLRMTYVILKGLWIRVACVIP